MLNEVLRFNGLQKARFPFRSYLRCVYIRVVKRKVAPITRKERFQ